MSVDLSLVIPTLNSARQIRHTLLAIEAALHDSDMTTEVIVVDDGSVDGTWGVLAELAKSHKTVFELKAIRLRRNVGQHSSTLCGLQASRGTYIVTLDDDLQNDPAEIPAALKFLIDSGKEAVIVCYETHEKSFVRRLASKCTHLLVRTVFQPPPGIKSSPFRIMNRAVVTRICNTRKPKPFITGELFLATSSIANFVGIHGRRTSGRSNYRIRHLIALFSTILFAYTTKPTLAAIKGSLILSSCLFGWGTYVFISQVSQSETVPGYASTMIIVSLIGSSLLFVIGLVLKSLSFAISELLGPMQFDIAEKTS
jgi:undecaprenyl-phosphate 4-deoxy-4-formamido-L-arabinose transferase